MKQGLLSVLACCGALWPCSWAQAPAHPLCELLTLQQAPREQQATPAQRAAAYPSLALLPADTDSFLHFARLNEWMELLDADALSSVPGLFTKGFKPESFAIGANEKAARDVARLAQVVKLLAAEEEALIEQWVEAAGPDAARAVVAQLREFRQWRGEQLVELTDDMEVAPLHMVLSCRPGGESVLKQLSVMLMMVPVGVEGPLELMMRGNRRGFCLCCGELDLSGANLAPEHETQILKNLRNKRLYVMAEVRGRHLVLTICSNLKDVKLPSEAADSLLGSDTMDAYDDMLQKDTYVLSHSGAALVNGSRDVNLMEYQGAAQFMQRVFESLPESVASARPAAGALGRLMDYLKLWNQDKSEANCLRVWKGKDGAWYIHGEEEACGVAFEPGSLGQRAGAAAADTVFFAESTALQGISPESVRNLVNDVKLVQQGVLATLKPEAAARAHSRIQETAWVFAALDSYAALAESLSPVLSGNGALLVQETGRADSPVSLSLCAGALPATEENAGRWQEASLAFNQLPDALKSGWSLKPEAGSILFSTAEPPAGMPGPVAAASEQGGAVMLLNMQALARVADAVAAYEQTEEACENAALMRDVARRLERIEGACSIQENRMHYKFRLTPVK